MSDAGQAAEGAGGAAPEPSVGEIRVRLFGRTDVGQIREHNEDNFLVANLSQRTRGLREDDRNLVIGPRGSAFGVCDGMGGAAAGEVASQMAVDIVFERLIAEDASDEVDGSGRLSPDVLARKLVRAVEEAGTRIYEEARVDRSRRGMGTTATVAAMVNSRLFLAQVGDSRAYLLRDQKLVQVTRDQSLVNQLIEAGQLTEEEAETFEHNNIILQALGTAETVQVDLTYVDLQQGDTVLICSDGLSGMIRSEEIREVLSTVHEPMDACKQLTDRANAAGGHDNITVIVAKFFGSGLPAASGESAGYRKYALPGPSSPDATTRSGPVSSFGTPLAPSVAGVQPYGASGPTSMTPNGSGNASLRVGHTMMGEGSLLDLAPGAPGPRSVRPEEPVDIPTSGMAPALVGLVVIGCLLVAAAIGLALYFR